MYPASIEPDRPKILEARCNDAGNSGYDPKPLKFRDLVFQKYNGHRYGNDR